MANRYVDGIKEGKRQMVARLLDSVAETLDVPNDAALAKAVGAKGASISYWRSGASAPHKKALQKFLHRLLRVHIEPLAEIEPVQPGQMPNRAKWRIDTDKVHRLNLKDRLENICGIYLFYDSRGNVSYVGQAKRNLFGEIEQRLSQESRADCFTSPSGTVRLHRHRMVQGEFVRFISAYATPTGQAAHNIEALLIRSIRNNHANVKSANFVP